MGIETFSAGNEMCWSTVAASALTAACSMLWQQKAVSLFHQRVRCTMGCQMTKYAVQIEPSDLSVLVCHFKQR